jgi:hypothetical protein
MTARAMARMYAALLGEVDGVRLLSPERLREVTTLATSATTSSSGSWPRGHWATPLGRQVLAWRPFGPCSDLAV